MKKTRRVGAICFIICCFGLLLVFDSCAIDIPYKTTVFMDYDADSKTPLIEFLIDPNNPVADNYNNHLRKTVNYAKLPYKRTNINEFNSNPVPAPSTRVLVLLDPKTINPTGMASIINFVASGGTLVFLKASQDPKFGYLAGVKQNASYMINVKASGFVFKNNFIPLMEGKQYVNNNIHYGLIAENFTSKIEVLATAVNDSNYPTIIKNRFGKGTVITFNNSMYPQKQDRGILFAALLSGLDQVPYPIANVSTIFLDDFPSPMYTITKEPIKSEFNLSADKFYTDIWWPDMKELAKRYHLKYTAIVCFDYRNRNKPPFTTAEWDNLKGIYNGKSQVAADWLMQQVSQSGHELALHGFNHVSLKEDQWDNPDFMETSIAAANKKWITSSYGRLPITYVPPSNDIDSTGLASLHAGMPSIKYVSSVYLGDFDDGGYREYDYEPYNSSLFDFPRITSGYDLQPQAAFDQQSLYLYTGIWNHFVHPDDVFQIQDKSNELSKGAYQYRNYSNLGWHTSKNGRTGMLPRFEAYIKKNKQAFPLMRFLTVQEAAGETQRWRRRNYQHNAERNTYNVKLVGDVQKQKGAYWFTYVKQNRTQEIEKSLNSSNYTFSKTAFLEGNLYNIKTMEGTITLPNAYANKNLELLKAEQLDQLLVSYQAFINYEKSFVSINDRIAWLVANGDTQSAIVLLKRKIKRENVFNGSDWRLLHTYLGWEDRTSNIWPFMEDNLREKNRDSIVSLSRLFVAESDYPDLETRKLWMERQLHINPSDPDLNREYIYYFGTNEKKQISPDAILNLLKKEKNEQEKTRYAQILLEQDSAILLQYINSWVPCSEPFLIPLSDQIAWTFTDVGNHEQAIKWASCNNTIEQDVLLEWHSLEGNYQYLKEYDYYMYMEYLLENDLDTALKELKEIEPCALELQELYLKIAYSFGDKGLFRKAILWSQCIPDFPIKEKLQWYYELKEYTIIELLFEEYSLTHSDDYEIKVFMANVYLSMGNIKKSWILASSLPQSDEKETLRKQLNKDVLYADYETIKVLLTGYKSFFYPKTEIKIRKKIKYLYADILELTTNINLDRLEPTAIGLNLMYNLMDKNENRHRFGLSRYEAYELLVDSIIPENTSHSLNGVEYQFIKKPQPERFNFSGGFRLELDEAEKVFYHIYAQLTKSKDKLYSAFLLSHKPAITGPAYSLNIYRSRLNIYEEYSFNKTYTGVAFLESNYYSDGVWDGTLTLNFNSNFKMWPVSKLYGYAETAGMLGTDDKSDGYPYWTMKSRLYGGIGLGYEYKNPVNKVAFTLEAAQFLDTYSSSFQRFRGGVTLPITSGLFFTAECEFFTIKNFYSNSFNAGIMYYFGNGL